MRMVPSLFVSVIPGRRHRSGAKRCSMAPNPESSSELRVLLLDSGFARLDALCASGWRAPE
jgi:hypothetical protein